MAGKPCITKKWEDWELAALREAWPTGASKAAQAVLPHRSEGSLRGKANALRLNMEGRAVYRKQPSSEWIDAALRRAYRSPHPRLKALAKELDRTQGWLKWRAGILGLRRVAELYNRRWEPEELRILETCSERGLTTSTIHEHLQKAGYSRSLTAIRIQIDKQDFNLTRQQWTANDVAKMFGVDSHSVTAWIRKGWLSATRTIGPSADCWPDEIEERHWMYAVTPAALRKFMLAYPRAWDHRRLRVEVLLDLLCGGEDGLTRGVFGAGGHD